MRLREIIATRETDFETGLLEMRPTEMEKEMDVNTVGPAKSVQTLQNYAMQCNQQSSITRQIANARKSCNAVAHSTRPTHSRIDCSPIFLSDESEESNPILFSEHLVGSIKPPFSSALFITENKALAEKEKMHSQQRE